MESVEELFGSKGRTRILRIVAENVELNISEIARTANMNHGDTERHLEKFRDLGLIRERHMYDIRIFEPAFREVVVKFERGMGVRLKRDGLEDRPQDLP